MNPAPQSSACGFPASSPFSADVRTVPPSNVTRFSKAQFYRVELSCVALKRVQGAFAVFLFSLLLSVSSVLLLNVCIKCIHVKELDSFIYLGLQFEGFFFPHPSCWFVFWMSKTLAYVQKSST